MNSIDNIIYRLTCNIEYFENGDPYIEEYDVATFKMAIEYLQDYRDLIAENT